MKLFAAECRKLMKNPVYWIAVVLLTVFVWSQAASAFDSIEQPPEPGAGNYGMEAKERPEQIMPAAVASLYGDFLENSYVAYPIGFYKHVKLNWDKKAEMAGVLSELTGLTRERLLASLGKEEPADDGEGTTDGVSGSGSIEIEGGGAQLVPDRAGGYTIAATGPNLPGGTGAAGTAGTVGNAGGAGGTGAGAETENRAAKEAGAETGAFETGAFETGVFETGAAETGAAGNGPGPSGLVRNDLSYEEFKELMNRADQIIGGGSDYGELFRVNRFGMTPLTYEEALARYDRFVNQDKVTGAYARLVSDYLTIMCGLLPVFVTVAQGLADRRARMHELIWSRTVSAVSLTAARYSAAVVMLLVPLLAVAAWGAWQTYALYSGSGLALSPSAFFLCIPGWTLPTVMMSAAVGTFLTELTGTPLAVAVMGLWWFVDTNAGLRQMQGGYAGLPLIPRHNSMWGADTFAENFTTLAAGRFFYASAALGLAAAAAVILERKRRGKGHGTIRRFKAVRSLGGKKPAV